MKRRQGTCTNAQPRRPHAWAAWRVPILILCLVLLAACGNGGDDEPGTQGTTASTPTITATVTGDTPTAAETAAPQTSDRPVLGTRTSTVYTVRDPAFEALPGATAHFGMLGDAAYQIELPDDWNGDLVLWAHGFRGFDTEVYVDFPPKAIRTALIDEGYALAASSYSENGYAPGIGADDTAALRDYFVSEFGEPERVYLVGASMGGNIAALSLEHFRDDYDGALAVCGALGGEEQIDYLTSWAMAAEYTSGVTIPIGEGQLRVTNVLLNQVSPALGTPESPTLRGQQFIAIIRELTGGRRPFFLEGFADQYIANFTLVALDANRTTLHGRAATNEDTVYDIDPSLGLSADEINAGIRRLPADPEARDADAHPDAVPTTGDLSAPLLTLHGTGDLFVPISQEVSYLAKAKEQGTDDLLVQRAIRAPGHCNFSDEELVTAWHDLVAWVEDGEKPAGDDLSGDLTDIGMQFTSPLRPGDPGTVALRWPAQVFAAMISREVPGE